MNICVNALPNRLMTRTITETVSNRALSCFTDNFRDVTERNLRNHKLWKLLNEKCCSGIIPIKFELQIFPLVSNSLRDSNLQNVLFCAKMWHGA